MRIRLGFYSSFLFVLGIGWAHAAATQKTGIDEQAQLPYWEINDVGMTLRLVQRLPMQTRGFFLARGFNPSQVERIAQSCVFQTVFKNNSNLTHPSPLLVDLRQWRLHWAGKQQGLKTREDWQVEWQAEQVKKPQQLAFSWSLYPTRQEYKPGDYNWGMTSFNLSPGTAFDLEVVWQQYGKTQRAWLKGVQCAADINPQPTE